MRQIYLLMLVMFLSCYALFQELTLYSITGSLSFICNAILLPGLASNAILLHVGANYNHSRSYYTTPHDSTQGVPDYVFIGLWIIIMLFLLRLAWEYRNEIFKKKE